MFFGNVLMEENMSQHVVIKHNRYGIELVLDPKISFEKLLEVIVEKFQTSGNFFKDAKMAISFKGRKLSEEEMMSIVNTIMDNSTMQIVSIIDNDSELEQRMKARMDEHNHSIKQQSNKIVQQQPEMTEEMYVEYAMAQNFNAEFYKGNLRSGQVLECAASVTLIGDVNPVAKIIPIILAFIPLKHACTYGLSNIFFNITIISKITPKDGNTTAPVASAAPKNPPQVLPT